MTDFAAIADDVAAAEQAALDRARAVAGFDDFGDSDFRLGLRAMLTALRDERGLDGEALAAAVTSGPILEGLVGRLYACNGFASHPGHADVVIRRPVIIAGLPRSGTTALHHLLAEDDRFQVTENWLTRTPMPRPPRDQWQDYPEYRETAARAAADEERLKALHWVAADAADETNVILRQTCSGNFSLRGPLPGYDAFFLGRDLTTPYRYVRQVLQLIGLNAGEQPWLLKNPSDLFALDAILDVFPDAQIIVTHRDPVSAIPSMVSLMMALRGGTSRYGTDSAGLSPETIARRELGHWKIALDRYEAVKARHPASFHDVWQRDLHRDPAGVVDRIYDWLDLDLTADARTRMLAWADDNGRGKDARKLSPEDLGLTRQALEETYADYRKIYGFE